MSLFNRSSRSGNMLRTSLAGSAADVFNMLMAFAYRTVFIRLLSVAYLGVNGLFSNVLSLLSLAELGITAAVTYRAYGPISRGDVQQVGRLMVYYRRLFRYVALLVLLGGMALYPFLDSLILDASEVPADVDLHLVYVLYLVNTAASYVFAYRQTLLTADQRGYIRSLVTAAARAVTYALQIASLLIWRSYTLTLAISIAATVGQNVLFSLWVTRRYAPVFRVRELPDAAERTLVRRDMLAGGCHRMGAVILSSTDSLVLTRFAGLVAAGLYANYALILTMVKTVLLQLMGSGTASFGNARVEAGDEENHALYRRMLLINLAVTGWAAFCLYALIGDFIAVWLGEGMLLSNLTVIALCVQFYLDTGRFATDACIQGYGLFTRDRWRPFAEAALNIVISIVLVRRIGIAGVFIGTCVSFGLTAFWRAPLILYRQGFRRGVGQYWLCYLVLGGFTLCCCVLYTALGNLLGLTAHTWGQWLLKAVLAALGYAAAFAAVFGVNREFRAMVRQIPGLLRRLHR